jgi:hypothetical protein
MSTLRRAAALLAISGLAACGGGGSSTTSPIVKASQAPLALNAKANITLKLPTHFAIAKNAKKPASVRRGPAYINPSGSQFVVSLDNQIISDPSTGFAYFSLGSAGPDGSSTLTVPITSGFHGNGDLVITEYDSNSDELASGSNQSYTDSNGNFQDGTFNVSPGGGINLVLTMNMNNQYVVLTTDPVSGSDATAITNFNQCFGVNPGSTVYAFSADQSSGYVLPGSPAGYGGGDLNNGAYPGIPPVSIQQQFTENTFGSTSKLTAAPFGWLFVYDGSNGAQVQFGATNALFGSGINATAQINTPSNCG